MAHRKKLIGFVFLIISMLQMVTMIFALHIFGDEIETMVICKFLFQLITVILVIGAVFSIMRPALNFKKGY